MIRTTYREDNTRMIIFHYVRYADDFIILGNFDEQVAKQIKMELADRLLKNRAAKLSENPYYNAFPQQS